jgi:CO/xanthine dehydrogenase FAD-binding subunit
MVFATHCAKARLADVRVLTPATLDESLTMLADHGGRVRPVAGGTDLMVSWHHRVKDDWLLMDLSRLRPSMSSISVNEDGIELGGMTTYWDVMRSVDASSGFPLLGCAAGQVGAIQIQTRGTWAGNIANASPAADGVPVMMAYDAVIELASVRGRREVGLDAFYTGYKETVRESDELITAIRMPRRERSIEWFHKVGARRAQAITKVGVAVVSEASGWRVVANSVAPFVCRCRHLERALNGGAEFGDPEEIRAILDRDVTPIDDIRSTGEYRSVVLSRILFHALAGDRAG